MRSKWLYLFSILATANSLTGCGGSEPLAPPVYTVYGTVTGLDGTGLVLGNGDASLAIVEDGPFMLDGSFVEGSAYSVAVKTQPSAPAQLCTVSHGAGVVSANVSDVEVHCVTTPIAIASSNPTNGAHDIATDVAPSLTFSLPIESSSVQGHVTLNRGAHPVAADISITADDTVTLTPHERLSLLTTYTVTADAGLSGIYGEDVTPNASVSFTTRDGAWHTPQPAELTAPNGQDAGIAVMPDGSAVAVWYEYGGGFANVWANTYSIETGWGTSQEIDSSSVGDSGSPRVVADAHGHAFVVWTQSNGTRVDIWGRRYTEGEGWSPASQISETNVGSGNQSPSVGVDASGDVVIAWVNTASSNQSIWARAFPAVGMSGTATRIEAATGDASSPKVVVSAGAATVLWSNYDNVNDTVDLWANRYTSGAWETAAVVESTTDALSEYSLAVDGAGRVFAGWTQQIDASTQGIYARPYVPGTGWDAIATIAMTTNSAAYYPEIAADADGNAMLVWGQYDESVFHVYSSYFSAASGWGTPILIPSATLPKIAFDGSGNALAIWHAEVSITNRVVRSSRFVPGAGWGAVKLLTPGATDYAQYPQIGIDAFGRAMAVWIAYDSMANQSSIVTSRFDDLP